MKFSFILAFDVVAKQTRIIIANEKLYVEKSYMGEPGFIKWYLIAASNLLIGVYPFKTKPIERMEQEVLFFKHKESCFNKPDVIIADYINMRLVREFISGETYRFNAPPHIHYKVSEELGKCHASGWSLGDTKVSNFVYTGDKVYVVDAEQAIREGKLEYQAWDLLLLISTLSIDGYTKALHQESERERVFKLVLDGYAAGNPEHLEVFKLLKSPQFRHLVFLLVPFPLSLVFYRKLEEHVSSKL